MSKITFSFPPDSNFEGQWFECLAQIQAFEIEGKISEVDSIVSYLDKYEQQLLDCDPPYAEEAERINDLANLALRVTSS